MSTSLDTVLIRKPTFCLQVSLDNSTSSSQKANTANNPSTLGAEPLSKFYVIDLRSLRDNAPNSGDTLRLDEILDMVFPDVKRTTSDISNTGPNGLESFEV